MSSLDAREIPADPVSAQRLEAIGLAYRLIDTEDSTAADAFLRAETRGFLDPEPNDELLEFERATISARRNTGVFPAGAGRTDLPVATVNSWVTPLTVPGGEIDMWAISAVTVSGTHRRMGIARAMLEGELRAAAAAGVPVAGLTASEATLYERYGFAVAVPVMRVRVKTRRAGWGGSATAGRIEYLERPRLASDLGAIHERARLQRGGQIAGWPARWERMAGLAPNDTKASSVRGVRYIDEDGTTRGVLAYTLAEAGQGEGIELSVRHLTAETPDALRALWRFAVQHDLVTIVTAELRPVDDPLPLLVADQRGVEQTVHDHGWLRILDVPAVLSARTFATDVDVVVTVTDPLDLAAGTWRLKAVAGERATVEAAPEAAADITLGIAELSAAILGGVALTRLADAGRVHGDASHIDALSGALRAERMPHLAIWF